MQKPDNSEFKPQKLEHLQVLAVQNLGELSLGDFLDAKKR